MRYDTGKALDLRTRATLTCLEKSEDSMIVNEGKSRWRISSKRLILSSLGFGVLGGGMLLALIYRLVPGEPAYFAAMIVAFVICASLLIFAAFLARSLSSAVVLGSAAYVLLDFFTRRYLPFPLPQIADLINGLIVLLLGLAVAWRLWAKKIGAIDNFEQELRSVTEKVLQSDAFLKPLLNCVATGERDEELGLRGMPDILRSARERWQKSDTAATFYIRIMAVVGTIFAAVLTWLGYVVINDDASGIGRSLAEATEQQRRFTDAVERMESLESNSAFRSCCRSALNALRDSTQPKPLQDALAAFSENETVSNLEKLGSVLATESPTDKSGTIAKANRAVASFVESQSYAPSDAKSALSNLKLTLEEVSKRNREPEARVAGVLKRLAIGAVLASFFLAILRFLGGLHKAERLAAIRARDDELQARKFYVCLRSAGSNEKSVVSVLKSYLAADRVVPSQECERTESLETDVMKAVEKHLKERLKHSE
jgi:hypothetical protein